jgi:hypothetical protein
MLRTTHVPKFLLSNLLQSKRWNSSVPSRLPEAAPSFVPVYLRLIFKFLFDQINDKLVEVFACDFFRFFFVADQGLNEGFEALHVVGSFGFDLRPFALNTPASEPVMNTQSVDTRSMKAASLGDWFEIGCVIKMSA